MNTEAGALTAESAVHESRIKSGMTAFLRFPARLSVHLETIAEAEREQLPLWLPVALMLGIGAWFWLADAPRWASGCSDVPGRTGTCQISSAYSRMVRSEENHGIRATLRIEARVQAGTTCQRASMPRWAS